MKRTSTAALKFRAFIAQSSRRILTLECIAVALLGLINFAVIPFGFTTYAVLSGSMTPTISVGSLIYVDTTAEITNLKPSDIIAFYADSTKSVVCSHRVVENNRTDSLITTKGDANTTNDIGEIPYSNVVGIVRTHIPYLGYLLYSLQHQRAVWLCMIGLFTFVLIALNHFGSKALQTNNHRLRRIT